MATKAQNKATAQYRRKSVRQIILRFYPKDTAIYEHAKSKGGSTYIKRLISEDMDGTE